MPVSMAFPDWGAVWGRAVTQGLQNPIGQSYDGGGPEPTAALAVGQDRDLTMCRVSRPTPSRETTR
jgi:hypothetical protein